MSHTLPRGIRNHNPGNLNFVGQKGAQCEPGPHGRFAVFSTAEDGLRALRDQLLRYIYRDHITNVADIIAKWAPPTDGNDTPAYAATVAQKLGIGVHAPIMPLSPERLATLMAAIIHVENGTNPYGDLVDTIAHDQPS